MVPVTAFLAAICMAHNVLVFALCLEFKVKDVVKSVANAPKTFETSDEQEKQSTIVEVAMFLEDDLAWKQNLFVTWGNMFVRRGICWLLSVEAESPTCLAQQSESRRFRQRRGFLDGEVQESDMPTHTE